MKPILPLVMCAIALGCAGSPATPLAQPSVVALPNGSMQTAAILTHTQEALGAIECGQTAWYSIALRDTAPVTVSVHGQAQENSLGATVNVSVVAPNGMALGEVLIPVFARSPEWDPREQAFMPPAAGTYYLRVQENPSGCQRLAFRLLIR